MSDSQLNQNPFALLKVSVESTRDDIEDAFEERSAERPRDEPALLRAKQSLLTPKTRLAAELRWLLGSEPGRSVGLVEALSKMTEPELTRVLPALPPVARANAAADAVRRLPTVQLLPLLINAHQQFEAEKATELINGARARAAFPAAIGQQVKEQLAELARDHASSAVAGMIACGSPQRVLDMLVEDQRLWSGRLLPELVARYDQWASPLLAGIEADINDALATLPTATDAALDKIQKALGQWSELSAPLQRNARRAGLDEPRSLRVYRSVRSACVDLANEHQKFGAAADVVGTLRQAFEQLPTAGVELEADLALLNKLKIEQRVDNALKPLFEAVEEAKRNIIGVKAALKAGSLAVSRDPTLRWIASAYGSAHTELEGTEFRDAATAIVRSLALEMNNDQHDTAAALALLEGVAALNPAANGLGADIATLQRNLGWDRLNAAIAQKNLGLALQEANGLLAKDLDKDEREKVLSAKQSVEKRRSERMGGWLVLGVIGVLALFGWISSEISKSSSSSPPSSVQDSSGYAPDAPPTNASPTVDTRVAQAGAQPSPPTSDVPQDGSQEAAQPQAVDDGHEEQPPVQSGQVLTEDQIRYCVYTKARLEAAKPLVTTDSGVESYNGAVQDYNSRCGSFQYNQADLDAVNADLANNRSKIQAVASRLAAGWNG